MSSESPRKDGEPDNSLVSDRQDEETPFEDDAAKETRNTKQFAGLEQGEEGFVLISPRLNFDSIIASLKCTLEYYEGLQGVVDLHTRQRSFREESPLLNQNTVIVENECVDLGDRKNGDNSTNFDECTTSLQQQTEILDAIAEPFSDSATAGILKASKDDNINHVEDSSNISIISDDTDTSSYASDLEIIDFRSKVQDTGCLHFQQYISSDPSDEESSGIDFIDSNSPDSIDKYPCYQENSPIKLPKMGDTIIVSETSSPSINGKEKSAPKASGNPPDSTDSPKKNRFRLSPNFNLIKSVDLSSLEYFDLCQNDPDWLTINDVCCTDPTDDEETQKAALIDLGTHISIIITQAALTVYTNCPGTVTSKMFESYCESVSEIFYSPTECWDDNTKCYLLFIPGFYSEDFISEKNFDNNPCLFIEETHGEACKIDENEQTFAPVETSEPERNANSNLDLEKTQIMSGSKFKVADFSRMDISQVYKFKTEVIQSGCSEIIPERKQITNKKNLKSNSPSIQIEKHDSSKKNTDIESLSNQHERHQFNKLKEAYESQKEYLMRRSRLRHINERFAEITTKRVNTDMEENATPPTVPQEVNNSLEEAKERVYKTLAKSTYADNKKDASSHKCKSEESGSHNGTFVPPSMFYCQKNIAEKTLSAKQVSEEPTSMFDCPKYRAEKTLSAKLVSEVPTCMFYCPTYYRAEKTLSAKQVSGDNVTSQSKKRGSQIKTTEPINEHPGLFQNSKNEQPVPSGKKESSTAGTEKLENTLDWTLDPINFSDDEFSKNTGSKRKNRDGSSKQRSSNPLKVGKSSTPTSSISKAFFDHVIDPEKSPLLDEYNNLQYQSMKSNSSDLQLETKSSSWNVNDRLESREEEKNLDKKSLVFHHVIDGEEYIKKASGIEVRNPMSTRKTHKKIQIQSSFETDKKSSILPDTKYATQSKKTHEIKHQANSESQSNNKIYLSNTEDNIQEGPDRDVQVSELDWEVADENFNSNSTFIIEDPRKAKPKEKSETVKKLQRGFMWPNKQEMSFVEIRDSLKRAPVSMNLTPESDEETSLENLRAERHNLHKFLSQEQNQESDVEINSSLTNQSSYELRNFMEKTSPAPVPPHVIAEMKAARKFRVKQHILPPNSSYDADMEMARSELYPSPYSRYANSVPVTEANVAKSSSRSKKYTTVDQPQPTPNFGHQISPAYNESWQIRGNFPPLNPEQHQYLTEYYAPADSHYFSLPVPPGTQVLDPPPHPVNAYFPDGQFLPSQMQANPGSSSTSNHFQHRALPANQTFPNASPACQIFPNVRSVCNLRDPRSILRDPRSILRDPRSILRSPRSILRSPKSILRSPRPKANQNIHFSQYNTPADSFAPRSFYPSMLPCDMPRSFTSYRSGSDWNPPRARISRIFRN